MKKGLTDAPSPSRLQTMRIPGSALSLIQRSSLSTIKRQRGVIDSERRPPFELGQLPGQIVFSSSGPPSSESCPFRDITQHPSSAVLHSCAAWYLTKRLSRTHVRPTLPAYSFAPLCGYPPTPRSRHICVEGSKKEFTSV